MKIVIQLILPNINSFKWCKKTLDEHLYLFQVLSNLYMKLWIFWISTAKLAFHCNMEQGTKLFFQTSHYPDVKIFAQNSDKSFSPFWFTRNSFSIPVNDGNKPSKGQLCLDLSKVNDDYGSTLQIIQLTSKLSSLLLPFPQLREVEASRKD